VCGVGAVYHSCLLSLAWYLQVVIRTSTSSATGYYLVPYHDRDEATFTMEAKELSANENFIVRWNVPMSTTEDTIGRYQLSIFTVVSQ